MQKILVGLAAQSSLFVGLRLGACTHTGCVIRTQQHMSVRQCLRKCACVFVCVNEVLLATGQRHRAHIRAQIRKDLRKRTLAFLSIYQLYMFLSVCLYVCVTACVFLCMSVCLNPYSKE